MKSRKGNALIVVVVATMAMLLLISAAIAVTVPSRQLTARNINFIGMYDLAVAGNERAVYLLRQNSFETSLFPYTWHIGVNFTMPCGRVLQDVYRVTTTVSTTAAGFTAETVVTNYAERERVEPGRPVPVLDQVRVSVTARINKTFSITLDDYVLTVIQLRPQPVN